MLLCMYAPPGFMVHEVYHAKDGEAKEHTASDKPPEVVQGGKE